MPNEPQGQPEDDAMELDRREFLADSLIVSAAAASWWGLSLKSDALAQTQRSVPETLPDPEDHSSHYSYNH